MKDYLTKFVWQFKQKRDKSSKLVAMPMEKPLGFVESSKLEAMPMEMLLGFVDDEIDFELCDKLNMRELRELLDLTTQLIEDPSESYSKR